MSDADSRLPRPPSRARTSPSRESGDAGRTARATSAGRDEAGRPDRHRPTASRTPRTTGRAASALGVRGWILRTGLTAWLLLGVLVLGAAVWWALSETRALIGPLIAALVIAAVAAPVVDRLARHMTRAIASGLVVLGIVAATIGFLAAVGWVIYRERSTLVTELQGAREDLEVWVDGLPIDSDRIVGWAQQAAQGLGQTAGRLVAAGAASAAAFVVGTFLALILLYYLLKQWDEVLSTVSRTVRQDRRADMVELLDGAAGSIRGYFRGRAAVSAITSAFMGVGVVALGIPAAAAIVLVNFVGGFIPYIGAFLGGTLAVLLGLASGGIPVALGALGVMLVGNLVVEQLVEPRLVGANLGLNPLLVLLATTLGGVLAGLPGLILGAPVAATVLSMLRTLRRWNVFADEVDDGAPADGGFPDDTVDVVDVPADSVPGRIDP